VRVRTARAGRAGRGIGPTARAPQAGRGRTLAVAAAYLLWAKRLPHVKEALAYVSKKMGVAVEKVVVPTQERCVLHSC
jgi:protein-tyrosine phosphatase